MASNPFLTEPAVRRSLRGKASPGRSRSEGRTRPRLAEHFARSLVFALQIRDATHHTDPAVLRRRAVEVIDQASRSARRADALIDDVREAEYAVVALIDEAVMVSNWEGKEIWKSNPIQLERYDRFDAGEQFFERMERLRDRPDGAEALEVFFLCLALGFKGRYQFLPPDDLRRLIEDVQGELTRGRGLYEETPLSPHGYPSYSVPTAAARSRSSWPYLVGAFVIALVLFGLGRFLVGSDASDAARTIERLPTTETAHSSFAL